MHLKKNTDTKISPTRRLPAASIFLVSGIAVQPAIAYDLRGYGNAIFLYETN